MHDHSDGLRELARSATLVDVFFVHLEAVRFNEPALDPPAAPSFQLKVEWSDDSVEDEQGDEVRPCRFHLRVTAKTGVGALTVEPVAEYAFPAELSRLWEQPTITEFANEVAVMTLLPYAREALQDLSTKVLRESLLMPSFPRGAISFPAPDARS